MVALSGNDPRHAPTLVDTFSSKGLLVKYTASGLELTDAVDATPIGYTAAESSRGEDGALEAAGTATASILPLNGLVHLKVHNAIASPKFGMSIYVAQTSGASLGMVDDDNSNSATLVGYYCGDESAISAGDFIPVWC